MRVKQRWERRLKFRRKINNVTLCKLIFFVLVKRFCICRRFGEANETDEVSGSSWFFVNSSQGWKKIQRTHQSRKKKNLYFAFRMADKCDPEKMKESECSRNMDRSALVFMSFIEIELVPFPLMFDVDIINNCWKSSLSISPNSLNDDDADDDDDSL